MSTRWNCHGGGFPSYRFSNYAYAGDLWPCHLAENRILKRHFQLIRGRRGNRLTSAPYAGLHLASWWSKGSEEW